MSALNSESGVRSASRRRQSAISGGRTSSEAGILGSAGRHPAADLFEPVVLVQEDDMIDLGQIVIVRGQPKDRDEASRAAPAQASRRA